VHGPWSDPNTVISNSIPFNSIQFNSSDSNIPASQHHNIKCKASPATTALQRHNQAGSTGAS